MARKTILVCDKCSREVPEGKGAVMRLEDGKDLARGEIGVVPTGSISIDLALGIGGFPRGRIVEIYGPESSGKTTLALHGIGEAQRLGGVAAFIDAEHALDVNYAKKLDSWMREGGREEIATAMGLRPDALRQAAA